MDSAFVSVARFRSLLTAQYYESLLQESGVGAFLSDAHTMELCSPQFWFISLGKQLRLLVPASEQQQAFDVLREAVENASALALDPIRDGEEFPEEEPVEIEFDRSGLRFFFIYAGFIIALFVLYWVLHVAGATL